MPDIKSAMRAATHRVLTVGRRTLGFEGAPGNALAHLHRDETVADPLTAAENRQVRNVALLGATGTIMMAIGALGVGAQPVLQNPTQGVRVLGLFARTYSSSLAITMTGTVLVVIAWLLMGRFALGQSSNTGGEPRADGQAAPSRLRRMTRSQLDRTLLLWILPLAVAPPMFSRDVYSYLAQSEITARGMDPYQLGPAQALGVTHVLTRTVPNIWRDTPAPYGPLSLWLGRGISELTGDNIIAGIFLHRLLAIGGVALIVWALPRLAQRCGVAPVSALWLGAANPLLLFHLVSGVHNEAEMLGLMLAGIELSLRAIESAAPLRGKQLALLIAGVAVISLGSTIKIPALFALGFVGMALARRWGPNVRSVAAAAVLLTAIFAVVTLVISLASGLGFGWLHTLNTASVVRSWMSLPTSVGVIIGFVGVLLGIGDHTTALLTLTRPIAELIAAIVAIRMLISTYTGRLHPVGALGIALAALVLLFPVVQPWYLLWAVIPLAAWATMPVFRVPTVLISALVSVILMPSGKDEEPFVIVQAAVATAIVCCAVIAGTRYLLPWRVSRNELERAPVPDSAGNSAYSGSS